MGQDANGNSWTESNIPIPSFEVEVFGCTDPSAFNYDSEANTDDGSCISVVTGCTDAIASNYDSSANTDDGSCSYSSTFVGLVLETVDNSSGGFNNGAITYNLYAELDGGLITFIFADESNPLEITTSTSFIDNQFGADIQGQVNDAFFALAPSAAYDTWLTIGDSYSSAAQTTPGLDLSSGFSGSSLLLGGSVNSDAAIFRTPDDPLCLPNSDGYVLLGQFTTTGVLSGFINLMGQDANGNSWTESNIPIPSIEVEVFGCTDPSAFNYDSSANTDDGSCEFCQVIDSFINHESVIVMIGMELRILRVAYIFATANSVGCDSVATLNLTINNSSSSQDAVTACDSYDWNGEIYTESGTYTFATTNSVGCDSVATLNLTINNSSSSQDAVIACDSYDWNGFTYTESGTYTFATTNSDGCDSVATLNLTINNSSSSQDAVTACDSYLMER